MFLRTCIDVDNLEGYIYVTIPLELCTYGPSYVRSCIEVLLKASYRM